MMSYIYWLDEMVTNSKFLDDCTAVSGKNIVTLEENHELILRTID